MKPVCLILGGLALVSGLEACHGRAITAFPNGDGMSAPQYGDSLVDVMSKLMRHVQLIDSVGRARGALPNRLDEALPSRWLQDIFGNPLEYSVAGPSFTVRSAGRDGILDTPDDISVTGRLGRSVPCELRSQNRINRFEERAPLCSEVPIVMLPTCPDAEFLSLTAPADRPSGRSRDRVLATGERLVRLARRIDGRGRALGVLPPPGGLPWVSSEDAWGHTVQYKPDGRRFELRSAGSDGVPGTADDILVRAELGGIIRCEFTYGVEIRSCRDPLPQCPGAGEPIIEIQAFLGVWGHQCAAHDAPHSLAGSADG